MQQSKKNTNNLLTDPVKSLIFKLSLPVMLSGLLRTSYNFIDLIFASRLGGVQVASVAFVGPLFMLVQALGLGLSLGGVSIIAKSIGQGKSEKASDIAIQLRLIITLIAILLSIVGLFFTESILRLLGVSGELLDQSSIYTKIRFLSIPFTLIFQYYMSLYKSQGKMNMVLTMAIVGLGGNTILNTFFIYVLETGIAGLSIATISTQIIQAVFVVILYHKDTHSFHLSKNPFCKKVDFKIWKKLIKVGLPLSFSHASTSFGFLLINMFIVGYGFEVVAAFSIGNQINSIFYAPSSSIGQAMLPLIAQNWGNKGISRLKESIKAGMTFSITFGFVSAVLILFLIKPLGTFLANGDLLIFKHVSDYLGIMYWAIIPWSIFQGLSGVFNGFQKTKITMYINVIRLWGVRIPGILISKYLITSVGSFGVWYTMLISNTLTAIAAIILYFIIIHKRILINPLYNK